MTDQLKNAIRSTIKQVRSKLSNQYQLTSSEQVCTRIRSLEPYRQAKRIALYHAINGEIDLASIWGSAPLHGKFCYFPVLTKEATLIFLPATPNTPFKKNKYGILEPDVDHKLAIPIEELDVLFIPLVAFDLRCTRLGMGGGYYDRTLLNKKNCLFVGIAYQFQRVDYIPHQPWDVALDAVITQRAIYWREAPE